MNVGRRSGINLAKGTLAIAVLALTAFAAGCGGGERDTQGQSPAGDQTASEPSAAEGTSGETTAREGEMTEETTVGASAMEETEATGDRARGGARGGARDGVRAREVLLRIEGDSGTTFSGTCTIGDEEEQVDGEVPQRFTYELGGGKLECEITNEGPGGIEIVLRSGNDRSVQRVNTSGAVINLTYSKSGVSTSTTSSTTTSSGSVNQQSSSSVSSSSSSSVSQRSSQSSGGSR